MMEKNMEATVQGLCFKVYRLGWGYWKTTWKLLYYIGDI